MSTAMAVTDHTTPNHFQLRLVDNRSGEQRRLNRDDLKLLALIATGIPLTSVAGRMGISDRTVRRRVRGICDTLEVTTMIESVAWAARRRLI